MTIVQLGLWQHYKGGLYTVIGTGTHHETRKPMVMYVSHTYGGINLRPVRGWPGDPDGWNDSVEHEGKRVPRFTFLGDLPSDVPIDKRVGVKK